MGIPINLNLYQITHKISILTFMVTNSAPNTVVSMIDCFLEYQLINDWNTNLLMTFS